VVSLHALRGLLEALAGERTVFLLGAGASAPEMPTMKELVRRVQETLRESVGSFFPARRGPLHDRFLPVDRSSMALDPRDTDGRYAHGVSEETLKLAIHRHLEPSGLQLPLAQYQVFDLFSSGATLLNYNTDGLADRCRQQLVKMHGNVVPGFTEWLARERTLREAFLTTQDGIPATPQTLLFPEPEPEDYLVEARLPGVGAALEQAAAVVVIGYSFGIGCNTLDDRNSYEFFCRHLRDRAVPVVIVDPGGQALAERLGEALRTSNVILVPAFWNLLAKAILKSARERGASGIGEVAMGEVLALYERELDRL
jgi:hypothetical protein